MRNPLTFPRFPDELCLNALESYFSALEISPISAVDWQCNELWSIESRIVPDSMFFYIYEGFGQGHVEDKHFDLQPGDMMIMPKGAAHGASQKKGHVFRLSSVHFHPLVFGGVNILDLLGFPVHVRTEKGRDDIIETCVRQLDQEFAVKAPGYRRAAASCLMQIFLHIVRHFGSTFTPPFATDKSAELRRLLPAFDYLERNIEDGSVCIGDLAKTVHLSEVQFRKLFGRVTGLSPARYIQSRRIERACRLLRESDASIEQAASATGFADTAFFCRVFKSWTKSTPTEYRRMQL
jgi:AraC-like DNA-binding protein